jgi:hypothetical protein
MADDQSKELVREMRGIRFILMGILVLLAIQFAVEGIRHWSESHYQSPRASQSENPGETLANRLSSN